MTCSDEAIAVVVVTYRSAESIDACLHCLRQAEGVAQIRVVDNGSDDGTLEIVQRHAAQDPRVHFIGNPDNPGFATACNQGAADSQAPWLAFVNPDLMVAPDTLARLRALASAQPAPVLLGADLVDLQGVRDAAARRRDPDFVAMLRHPSAASQLGVPVRPELELQAVDAVSGALVLLPRALFERLHGWDAGYRLHAEDLDLCRRARLAGAGVAVANQVSVLHLRGVSSRTRPLFVEWHKHRGLWRYFQRFDAPQRAWPVRWAVAGMIGAHWLLVAARALSRR